jgi:hypothetical protein
MKKSESVKENVLKKSEAVEENVLRKYICVVNSIRTSALGELKYLNTRTNSLLLHESTQRQIPGSTVSHVLRKCHLHLEKKPLPTKNICVIHALTKLVVLVVGLREINRKI